MAQTVDATKLGLNPDNVRPHVRVGGGMGLWRHAPRTIRRGVPLTLYSACPAGTTIQLCS